MIALGLDIGTTSVCITAVDAQTGNVVRAVTLDNGAAVEGAEYERCQNPQIILEKCIAVTDKFIEEYSPVAIGVTGQMHGILYLDKDGNPLSNLYTWQDMSGELPYNGACTYVQELSALTGYPMASGYGFTTLYVHTLKNCVPENTAVVCTIHDYVAMKLAGLNSPVMHTSDAASFGLFDKNNLCFDKNALTKAGLSPSLLPKVTAEAKVLGCYRNIPVCVAIGDNQASFIGSVSDAEKTVLLNVGTGSQISFFINQLDNNSAMETRPLHQNSFICVGSALCGGRAFAALEHFLREVLLQNGDDVSSAYPMIDRYLAEHEAPANPLAVKTVFSGTRENPAQRGSIGNLGLDNFTPGHLIYGVLYGITQELFEMYSSCHASGHTCVVGSGNGLRKNTALQKIVSEVFGMPLRIPSHTEEAAYGAVLYALTATGKYATLQDAQKLIQYQR